jgi:hypothetical protein
MLLIMKAVKKEGASIVAGSFAVFACPPRRTWGIQAGGGATVINWPQIKLKII